MKKSTFKKIVFVFFGTLLTYFFSTKEFAQSVSFYYGPGIVTPPEPKLTPKNLQWWIDPPVRYFIIGIAVLVVFIVGLFVVIKKRRKKNVESRKAKTVDNTQRTDKEGT